jgi:hypothetical protein
VDELYYPSSRLIPLLDVINTPIQVPDIVDFSVSFYRVKTKLQSVILTITIIIITKPIVTKAKLTRQILANNSYTNFHDSQIKSLDADITSHGEGRT